MSKTPVNKNEKIQQVPEPHTHKFDNGIRHPLLYLWDAWSYIEADVMHLYCLALSRLKSDGTALLPMERNDFPFHIRHFTSKDSGKTWKDEGCFLRAEQCPAAINAYTIWSGSIEPLADGRKLVAYTALEKSDAAHTFIQNIALAVSADGYVVDQVAAQVLSSPRRDWKEITEQGYYLAEQDQLGSNEGEGGGPIMSWRDPFIFIDNNDKVNLFWGAKVSPTNNALVRAELEKDGAGYKLTKLLPPVTVPDGDEFTQLELPKVYFDKERSLYYLLVSSCNRLYEGQSDEEVDKGVRAYKSSTIDGPWESLGDKILGTENLFGPTVLKTDFENNRLLCIAPYTDAAADNISLTFSPVFYIYLDKLRVEFL